MIGICVEFAYCVIDELENADTITTEEAAALIGSATSGAAIESEVNAKNTCLLYTSPSPRD